MSFFLLYLLNIPCVLTTYSGKILLPTTKQLYSLCELIHIWLNKIFVWHTKLLTPRYTSCQLPAECISQIIMPVFFILKNNQNPSKTHYLLPPNKTKTNTNLERQEVEIYVYIYIYKAVSNEGMYYIYETFQMLHSSKEKVLTGRYPQNA